MVSRAWISLRGAWVASTASSSGAADGLAAPAGAGGRPVAGTAAGTSIDTRATTMTSIRFMA